MSNLTAGRLRELLHYNPITGDFSWRSFRNGKVAAGAKAGSVMSRTAYIAIGIDKKYYRAHRLAWLYVHGVLPDGDIDHIDGNPSNNAIENLREASESTNLQNQRKAHKSNKTGFLGVCRSQGRYAARIRVDGKELWLGRFDTPIEAHAAYIESKRKYHKGCTL